MEKNREILKLLSAILDIRLGDQVSLDSLLSRYFHVGGSRFLMLWTGCQPRLF